MMISPTRTARRNAARRRATSRTLVCAAGLLAVVLALPWAGDVAAAPGTVSASDGQCLTCHSMAGLTKSLGNGEKLSLHVAAEDFGNSVHAMVGCRGCHRDVELDKHPVMSSIASGRAHTLVQSEVCRSCHAAKFKQYEGSIHASLVAAGDPSAPVCSNCHDPHSIQPMAAYAPLSGQPCRTCHEEIFDAYAGSVHGKARVEAGHIQAPICSNCHQAHDISAVAAGDRLKQACLGCHEGALLAHEQWLPNSARHLESVACPACHSPLAERGVDLRLYDAATRQLVAEAAGDAQFEERVRRIDVAGDGLDPLELWTLVRQTKREGAATEVTLRGRLEVRSGVEAHRLAVRLEAVRNCNTCHEHGSEAFRNVTISVTAADGRRIKYAAGGETLTSAVSVDTVGGFYTAGSTRIKALDFLLVLAIMAGLGVPITHWTMRKFLRKKG